MKQFTKIEWAMFWFVRFTILLFYIAMILYSLTMFAWYISLFFTALILYLFIFETISLYRYNKEVLVYEDNE